MSEILVWCVCGVVCSYVVCMLCGVVWCGVVWCGIVRCGVCVMNSYFPISVMLHYSSEHKMQDSRLEYGW